MRHNLACSAIRDLLAVSQPEIDLSCSEYKILQNHLKTCPACQAIQGQYMLLTERLQEASTQITNITKAKHDACTSEASISLSETITEDTTEIDASNLGELPSVNTEEFPERFLVRDEIQERKEISDVSDIAMSKSSQEREKGRAMCIINMRVRGSETFSEVLVDEVEHTELTIESIIGTALLEVFDTVLVDNVTVQPSSERNDGDKEQRQLLS